MVGVIVLFYTMQFDIFRITNNDAHLHFSVSRWNTGTKGFMGSTKENDYVGEDAQVGKKRASPEPTDEPITKKLHPQQEAIAEKEEQKTKGEA